MVWGPYWNCSVSSSSSASSSSSSSASSSSSSSASSIAFFEGLNMLQNSWNFAHASELAKIYIWYGFQKWVCQNGSIAPPIKFQRSAPQATFHVHARNSVHTCNTPLPTKKVSWYEIPTGNLLFWISCMIFVIFMPHTLTNSHCMKRAVSGQIWAWEIPVKLHVYKMFKAECLEW